MTVKTYTPSKQVTEEEKEKIIKDFLPFIKYTAHRIAWKLPPQLTVDDLVSVGLMGLLDALQKFEHGRVKLKTYAEIRIRGAMLDELRAVDWVPRSLKRKLSGIKNAHARLERKLGRCPEGEEVAASMDLSLDEYYKILHDASGSISLRFEDFTGSDSSGDGLNVLECIPDGAARDPLEILEFENRKEVLAGKIGELPERERFILSLYYWEGMTMREIGQILELTESRVCQLHSQAVLRLKAKLSNSVLARKNNSVKG